MSWQWANPSSTQAQAGLFAHYLFQTSIFSCTVYMLYSDEKELKKGSLPIYSLYVYTCIPWESINTQICCALFVSTCMCCSISLNYAAKYPAIVWHWLFIKPCTFTVFFLALAELCKGIMSPEAYFVWVWIKHELNDHFLISWPE